MLRPGNWLRASMTDHSPASVFERIAAKAQSAASQLRVKSALNPMLWMCGIVSLPCYVLAYFSYASGFHDLGMAFVYIGSVPIVGTVLGFFYFGIVSPEKLQSEEYQLRHETIELIKQKGSAIEISPSSLEAIANPTLLPSGRGRR
jgi:hypothetical protein